MAFAKAWPAAQLANSRVWLPHLKSVFLVSPFDSNTSNIFVVHHRGILHVEVCLGPPQPGVQDPDALTQRLVILRWLLGICLRFAVGGPLGTAEI